MKKDGALNASSAGKVISSLLDNISNENTAGMAGVDSNDIYSYITDLIINTIKKVGHLPWQKNWIGSGGKSVMNYVSKKEYTGANYLLNFDIKFDEDGNGYLVPAKFVNPYYLTFNQIKDSGATLQKGAKAHRVIYYNFILTFKKDALEFKTADKEKFARFIADNNLSEDDLRRFLAIIPIIKYYNVFRADDCTGLTFETEAKPLKDINPIEVAQNIIDGYKNPPTYTFVGDRAFYQPANDLVNMPLIQAFNEESSYYSTYFHELVHSTGSEKRLKRDFSGAKGSKNYAYEELIAELGAVFLCGEAGILFHTLDNSAKYLASWNRKLVSQLEADNRFYLKAAAAAQKAVNLILDRNQKEEIETEKVENKTPKIFKKQMKSRSSAIKKAVSLNATSKDIKASVQKKNTVVAGTKKASVQIKTTVLDKEKKVHSEKIKTTVADLPKNSLAARKASKNAISREYYQIDDKEISDLLGKIERKSKESVAITIAGVQGSGKTRFVFQLINAFSAKYKVGHASMEEHPESALYEDKALQYWSDKAINEVDAPEITSMTQLHKLIRDNDVIIVDSFAKLRKIDKAVSLDEDLRKKYHGKLFIVIYQLTSTGQMRGGSDSQFDADIVLFAEKDDDYKKNYIRIDKNRYNDRDDLKFNIYTQRIQKNPGSPVQPKIKKLSFKVT